MVISADRLDDLLAKVFRAILGNGRALAASRGANRELFGVLLHLEDPRARISRTEVKSTLYSGLGELCWYLAGSNALDFICYYASRYEENSDDGITVHGAYGPRLTRMHGSINQIENVVSLLKSRPTSRRAVIQLFDAEDLTRHFEEIPCTCTLQFAIRDQRLQLLVNMRSNDAFVGLPHDVFAFTMLQEICARKLDVELGSYHHAVGSMHLYDSDLQSVNDYLKQGWHEKMPMPPMPQEDPWPSIRVLLGLESELREGRDIDLQAVPMPPYWADIARLLMVYRCFKNTQSDNIDMQEQFNRIDKLKSEMTSRFYDQYIEKKKTKAKPEKRSRPGQLSLRW